MTGSIHTKPSINPHRKTVAHQGLLVSAPASGSGKTMFTLGLLRALKNANYDVRSAKAGPDYIDPKFHEVASGAPCINLDPWAMRPELLSNLAASQAQDGLLIVEGMMGLFDGAADGTGSGADLAEQFGLSVILVVDAGKQSHSIAALVRGFATHRSELSVAGVVLNKVGSPRHEAMLRSALEAIDVPVLGAIPRDKALEMPERHLGLVQAAERDDLEAFIEAAATVIADGCDIEAIVAVSESVTPLKTRDTAMPTFVPVLGQRIAVAIDIAFAFSYPHLLEGWRQQGAEILPFSPLNNEAPAADADAIYLPGGYPELHAGKLASNFAFLDGLANAQSDGALIYGECGGYMVLGDGLICAKGERHKMAGLLPLVTSFENRKLHLGYRLAKPLAALPISTGETTIFKAHEFHYSTVVSQGEADALFDARDATGAHLGYQGLRRGNVMGCYMHLIDACDPKYWGN